MSLLYVVMLLVAFYLLLTAEFFLPTSGFLGVASLAALIASVVIAFGQSTTTGFTVLAIALVTTPLMIFTLIQWWPHTPIGRRMLNRRLGEIATNRPLRTTSHGIPLGELVGKVGIAKTDLLPSGMIVIGDDRVDAVSIGMPIDAGSRVVVTSVNAGKIHVRPATEDDDAHDRVDPKLQSPPSLEESLDSFDSE